MAGEVREGGHLGVQCRMGVLERLKEPLSCMLSLHVSRVSRLFGKNPSIEKSASLEKQEQPLF